jgi:hypothetical protein
MSDILSSMCGEENTVNILENIHLFKIKNTVIACKKLQKTIDEYVSESLLKAIHKDKRTAIDLCLIFASLITQYGEYETIDYDTGEIFTNNRYTYIASSRLSAIFGEKRYLAIKKLLMRETKTKKPFIECDDNFIIGSKVYGYRYTEDYRNKGLKNFNITSPEGIIALHKIMEPKLRAVTVNIIARKIFMSYPSITLPTIEEIQERGEYLIKNKIKLKNGKLLKKLNKMDRSCFVGDYSFIEDGINRYKLLTDGGLLIPVITGDNAGGRVVDSFTLMPSWIRDMVQLDGVNLKDIECDYTALHPNINLKLYGSPDELQTLGGDIHTKVANGAMKERLDVKIDHLSFFNKRYQDMEKMTDMWDFYWTSAPNMMRTLSVKKTGSVDAYKSTTKEVFKFEVDMMTEVVNRMGNENMLYVYDALYCKNTKKLKKVMSDVAKEFGLIEMGELIV